MRRQELGPGARRRRRASPGAERPRPGRSLRRQGAGRPAAPRGRPRPRHPPARTALPPPPRPAAGNEPLTRTPAAKRRSADKARTAALTPPPEVGRGPAPRASGAALAAPGPAASRWYGLPPAGVRPLRSHRRSAAGPRADVHARGFVSAELQVPGCRRAELGDGGGLRGQRLAALRAPRGPPPALEPARGGGRTGASSPRRWRRRLGRALHSPAGWSSSAALWPAGPEAGEVGARPRAHAGGERPADRP